MLGRDESSLAVLGGQFVDRLACVTMARQRAVQAFAGCHLDPKHGVPAISATLADGVDGGDQLLRIHIVISVAAASTTPACPAIQICVRFMKRAGCCRYLSAIRQVEQHVCMARLIKGAETSEVMAAKVRLRLLDPFGIDRKSTRL